MGPVNIQLAEQARSIFSQLGYTVEGDGPEFKAERGWKVVHVTPVIDTPEMADGTGEFRCFVTDPAEADTVEDQLRRLDPPYEWAIIVVDGEDYAVERAPPGPPSPA